MEERQRDGGRDGCQCEKIIAPRRDAAIRVTLSPSVFRTAERHIWMVVNNLAGDQTLVLKGWNSDSGIRLEKQRQGRLMKLECYLFDSHPNLVIKVDIVGMEMKAVCMFHVSRGIYVFVCAPITFGD